MSELELLNDLVSSLDSDGLENIASLFAYQGFSVELVLSHLNQVKKQKNISDSNFKMDMRTLLVASIMMGNVTANNIQKISDKGKKTIDELLLKCGIKKGSISSDRKAITLPRLAATFPIQISKFQLSIQEKNYNNELNASILPKCFKVSIFPSLIPKTMKKELQHALLVISNAYSTEQSLAISKNKEISTVYKKQWEFTNIGLNSPMPKESDRISHIKTLQFHYDSMKQVFTNVYEIIKGIEVKVFPSREAWESEDLLLQ